MFNIDIAIKRQEQLKHDAAHGLPDKDRDYQEPILHIDGDIYNEQAGCEGIAISKAFKNKTMDFGRRLRRVYKQGGDTFPTGAKHRLIGRNS